MLQTQKFNLLVTKWHSNTRTGKKILFDMAVIMSEFDQAELRKNFTENVKFAPKRKDLQKLVTSLNDTYNFKKFIF